MGPSAGGEPSCAGGLVGTCSLSFQCERRAHEGTLTMNALPSQVAPELTIVLLPSS